MMSKLRLAIALACVTTAFTTAYACTTILVTKGASEDGSVFVTHSEDDELADQRMVYVPAADCEPGAKRAVNYDSASLGVDTNYGPYGPRCVGADRGPLMRILAGQPLSAIGLCPVFVGIEIGIGPIQIVLTSGDRISETDCKSLLLNVAGRYALTLTFRFRRPINHS